MAASTITEWNEATGLDACGIPLVEAQDAFVDALGATDLAMTLRRAALGRPLTYVEKQKLLIEAARIEAQTMGDDAPPF